MSTSWAIALVMVVLAMALLATVLREPRYEARSPHEFQRHISCMGRALTSGGRVDLHIPGVVGPIMIVKSTFKTKPSTLTVRITSGHQGRDAVARMSDAVQREGMEAARRYTKRKKLLRDFRLVWPAEDPWTPAAVFHSLRVCCGAVEVDFEGVCSIVYWGPLDPRRYVHEDDFVGPARAFSQGYVVGHAVGRVLRAIIRWLRK